MEDFEQQEKKPIENWNGEERRGGGNGNYKGDDRRNAGMSEEHKDKQDGD